MLLLAANILGWPIAHYVMSTWLQEFAYRVELKWWMFALAGGGAILVALITVGSQAIKAALANPV